MDSNSNNTPICKQCEVSLTYYAPYNDDYFIYQCMKCNRVTLLSPND